MAQANNRERPVVDQRTVEDTYHISNSGFRAGTSASDLDAVMMP